MNKYLLIFEKKGLMKYISHLDLLRLFRKSFKRADINLSYSEGYNPHPKLAFGQPLSLGYEGEKELLEFESEDSYDLKDFSCKLNPYLPEGIKIIGAEKRKEDSKAIASTCYEATYRILIALPEEFIEKKFVEDDNRSILESSFMEIRDKVMLANEIFLEKKSEKNSEKNIRLINIRPRIRSLSASVNQENCLELIVSLDAGSQSHLSCQQFVESFLNLSGIDAKRSNIEISRLEIKY